MIELVEVKVLALVHYIDYRVIDFKLRRLLL